MHNFINNNNKPKNLFLVIPIIFISSIANAMSRAPYLPYYYGTQLAAKSVKKFDFVPLLTPRTPLKIEPQEATIPQEIINASTALKNVTLDTSKFTRQELSEQLKCPQDVVDKSFTILLLYINHNKDELAKQINLLSFDHLISITNFIEKLDIELLNRSQSDTSIMNILIKQIGSIIENLTSKCYKDLSLFNTSIKHHFSSAHITLPYYAPLEGLNPEVEKKMKQLYSTKSLLFINIHNIWNLVDLPTQKLKQEKKQFTEESNKEPLSQFLHRNVTIEIFSHIKKKIYQNVYSTVTDFAKLRGLSIGQPRSFAIE